MRTRKEAKGILKNMLLKKKQKTGYVYFCEECQAYHTTSKPKALREMFRSLNKNLTEH